MVDVANIGKICINIVSGFNSYIISCSISCPVLESRNRNASYWSCNLSVGSVIVKPQHPDVSLEPVLLFQPHSRRPVLFTLQALCRYRVIVKPQLPDVSLEPVYLVHPHSKRYFA